MSTTYSGYTSGTAEKLLLDAGAFFVNFTAGTDTFASAVAAGKLLGATRGGGTFSAVPTMRRIQVDGIKGAAVGMQHIDEWNVTMEANVLEISAAALSRALASGAIDTSGVIYDEITAGNYLELTDYIDNITFVGKLSEADDPVIIQIYNAVSTSGLTLQTQDNNEAVISMSFTGHYASTDLDTPPFKIYYPKATASQGTITGTVTASAVASEGATVSVVINGIALVDTTDATGAYSIANVPASATGYTVVAYKGALMGQAASGAVTAGATTSGVDIAIA